MHYLSNLFDKVLYMFRTCSLSVIRSISTLYSAIGIFYASAVGVCYLLLCIQCWDTPDDGQWTCPKHV